MKILLIAVSLIFGAPISVCLAQVTSDGLMSICQKTYPDYETGLCDGFIGGIASALANRSIYCLPEEVEIEDLKKTVLKYGMAQDGKITIGGADVIILALQQRYPCETGWSLPLPNSWEPSETPGWSLPFPD